MKKHEKEIFDRNASAFVDAMEKVIGPCGKPCRAHLTSGCNGCIEHELSKEAILDQMAEEFIYSDEAKLEQDADIETRMSMYEAGKLQPEDI